MSVLAPAVSGSARQQERPRTRGETLGPHDMSDDDDDD